jgi:hypothetical protein
MANRAVTTDLTVTGTVNATTLQQGGSGVALASTLSSNALGVVVHGSTAGTARPSGFAVIHWIGTVEPTNAVNGDIWTDTDAT